MGLYSNIQTIYNENNVLIVKFRIMQEFYINQHSNNPALRMELICDGRYDYKKV